MPRRLRRMRRTLEEPDEEAVIVVSDEENATVLEDEDAVLPTQPLAAAVTPAAAAPPATATDAGAGAAPAAEGQTAASTAGKATAADGEAGSTCTICLDLLCEQGSHRPAALKCGHIFGNQCLRQWLQHKPRCPQCNKKAKARDITLLYNLPTGVAAGAGAAELEVQLQQEKERTARLQAQLQEMQRQLAVNKQQPAAAGPCAAAAAPPSRGGAAGHWQQQQQQQQQAAPRHAMAHQQHPQQQQQYHQQHWQQPQQYHHRLPEAISGPGRPWNLQQQQLAAAGPAELQGQQAVGQKRPWEQPATAGPAAAAAAAAEQRFLQQRQRLDPEPAAPPAAAAPAGAGAASSSTRLTLLPYRRDGAAGPAAAATSQQQQQQRWRQQQLAGAFVDLQQFKLEGSRCFHLDVSSAVLLVGERHMRSSGSCSKLRKISLVCPASPAYIQLPAAAGTVRGLAAQTDAGHGSSYGSQLMAVATERAGLQLVSMASNNAVQSVPVPGPVWSVAWSPLYEHQLLMGLDKGRLAVADLRKSGRDTLLYVSGSSSGEGVGTQQPLHSLTALHSWQLDGLLQARQGGAASSKWQDARPEAIVACAGGVFSWGRECPGSCFSQLLPSSWHGGTCESVALAPDGSALAASFRSPLSSSSSVPGGDIGGRGTPVHVLAKLGVLDAPPRAAGGGVAAHSAAAGTQQQSLAASGTTDVMQVSQADMRSAAAAAAGDVGVAAAVHAGRQRLLQETLLLGGHSSSAVITHGCFLPQLPGLQEESLLFASADEQSLRPRLWGCSSGAELVPRSAFLQMPSHVLQVAGGVSHSLGASLLGVMSERAFVLYSWSPEF